MTRERAVEITQALHARRGRSRQPVSPRSARIRVYIVSGNM
jgi:hypothetical protein